MAYKCFECGAPMYEDGDILICSACGHSVDKEDYDFEDEDYDDFYNAVIGEPADDSFDNEEFPGETYEDIY